MASFPVSDSSFVAGQPPEFGDPAASASRSFHAYIHIPFCRVRCGYCDFNTYTASELRGSSQLGFAAVLKREIEMAKVELTRQGFTPLRPASTVFFGGGTPSQLPADDLGAILNSIRQAFGLADGAEITTEANPDDVDLKYLSELRDAGFTRVSIGMQSAVPEVLATLERSHQPENVPEVVAAAKSVGLHNSVDLIYGAPNETIEQWRSSIEAAIALEPDHISAYSLIVEPGTKLARQISKGQLPEPDEDLQADKYELADALLSAAGYDWYEVSNWSRSLKTRSSHNLAYWQSQDWWGFGPGAHSHVGQTRWWNAKHPATYQSALESSTPVAGSERIDAKTRQVEHFLLQARVKEGISVAAAKAANPDASKVISQLIADRLIDGGQAIGGRIVLTLQGRLLADYVVRVLLG
jgi:oxygen-independent coproporphyrinogen-3 oxidase